MVASPKYQRSGLLRHACGSAVKMDPECVGEPARRIWPRKVIHDEEERPSAVDPFTDCFDFDVAERGLDRSVEWRPISRARCIRDDEHTRFTERHFVEGDSGRTHDVAIAPKQ